ncbi:hypothetical protein [Rhizobium phage RHph_N46]|nr:hypothetical protein [Rhizobium phage RHph_N46]
MAKVLEVNVPTKLNGYRVVESKAHENGYVTVMVDRDQQHEPYVVATWWQGLGESWSWGHYCDTMIKASETFSEVSRRNERRGNI